MPTCCYRRTRSAGSSASRKSRSDPHEPWTPSTSVKVDGVFIVLISPIWILVPMEIRTLQGNELPKQLYEIPQSPERLWLRGLLPPTGTSFLTVVGSRSLTSYGRSACEYLIGGLKGYPISIVSGLALGADACAHRAALAAGLHTIAIPGSGLADEVIYPRTNFPLAQQILESGGAFLSEHAPEHQALPHDFPSRNRLMVGLADAVLMIEAGEQSGTLITARLSAEYNRDLFCVPHRIGDINSEGTHQFIRLGAQLVSEPDQLLEALGLLYGDPSHTLRA